MLKPYDNLLPAVIIELKHTEKFTLMEENCNRALAQIRKKSMRQGLKKRGINCSGVMAFVFAGRIVC